MKYLIIFAHPNTKGHNTQILNQIKSKFDSIKIDYDTIDLYTEKYNPVLSADELYTAGGKSVSPQTLKYREKIKSANEIIFIAPIWWGTVPAIMHGFIDKVLVPEFAFKYNSQGLPTGLLKDKFARVFITSGTPDFVMKTILRNGPIKTLTKSILSFCGLKSKIYYVGHADEYTTKQKDKINKQVNKFFKDAKLLV